MATRTTAVAVTAVLLILATLGEATGLSPDSTTLYCVIAFVAAHLSIWSLALVAIRRAPELSALLWALFSPVLGLGLFGLLCGPVVDPLTAWTVGALAMIFSFGLPWVASTMCAVLVYRLVRAEGILIGRP